jgi:hypothetical protein
MYRVLFLFLIVLILDQTIRIEAKTDSKPPKRKNKPINKISVSNLQFLFAQIMLEFVQKTGVGMSINLPREPKLHQKVCFT